MKMLIPFSFERPNFVDFLHLEEDAFLSGFSNVGFAKSKDNKTYILTLDVPGIQKENLKVSNDNNYLKISGEEKAEGRSRKYQYSVRLPKDLNPEELEAKLENGVLTLSAKVTEKVDKLISIK